MKRNLVRGNLALFGGVLVLGPVAGVFAAMAWGVRKVVSVTLSGLTAVFLIWLIYTVAKDFDRKLTKQSEESDNE